MAYLIDYFLNRSSQFFIFATLTPQDFFFDHRQNHSVKMIVVNLFSQFLSCRYIDFISVHNSRYDIISTEFFLDKMKQRCTRGYKRYKETSGLIEWKECQIFHSIFT